MASTVTNGPGVPMVPRGKGTKIGAITATGQVVQFTVSQLVGNPNGFDSLAIFTDGNLSATTPILEVSIDGGSTWAGVVAPTNASSATTYNTTTLNSDTAVSSANGYTIAGIQGLGLFRFGFTTFTSGSGNVWVACS